MSAPSGNTRTGTGRGEERNPHAFRRKVASFAEANHIPVVPLKAADRNIEVMQPYLDAAASAGRSQVAAIGVAQEPQRVFIARKRDTDPGKCPQFSFDKKDRRVTVYYFYLWDAGFGPAFIKVCTYCPWPLKIWVNGHERAKQQCRKAGLGFTELSNGFASCDDPALLQRICDVLQPGTIEVFFQRWLLGSARAEPPRADDARLTIEYRSYRVHHHAVPAGREQAAVRA